MSTIQSTSSSSIQLTKIVLVISLIISAQIGIIVSTPSSQQFFLNGRYGRRSITPASVPEEVEDDCCAERDTLDFVKPYKDDNPHRDCYHKGVIGLFKCLRERGYIE